MSDHFREMALKAKAAYDEKVATERRKKEADADAKAKGILAKVEVLKDEVLPLLNGPAATRPRRGKLGGQLIVPALAG